MIALRDKENGRPIGSITPAQLEFLVSQLEEESADDTDYYITPDTLDWFEEQGADAPLVELLRRALADREGMEIEWTRQ